MNETENTLKGLVLAMLFAVCVLGVSFFAGMVTGLAIIGFKSGLSVFIP